MVEQEARDRIVIAARFVLAMAVLAGAQVCLAQDGRSDDPPDPPPGATQGNAPQPAGGLWSEPQLLTSSIRRTADKLQQSDQQHKDGWYLELSNTIAGAGWVSVGPGYRRYLWNDKTFADVSAAASWHLYKMAQGRIVARDITSHHLTFGAQTMWQDYTQVRYFGIGSDSLEENESQYRVRSVDVVGYAGYRPRTSMTISQELGWLHSPKLSAPAGTFKPELPATIDGFPADPGVTLDHQPDYVHSQTAVTIDTRDHRGHPTRGGFYRVAATVYADQRKGLFSFRQYEAEAAHVIRVMGPNWLAILHGWVAATDVSAGHDVPFYLQPSLGGSTTLRSYPNYRFHDGNLALLQIESRWALYPHVDAALFVDAGNVAASLDDLRVDKTSWGAGVRLHTQRTTLARVDVAQGAEGWRVVVSTTDPFRFSRTTRRVAGLPFVP